jgi:hypothetical protein
VKVIRVRHELPEANVKLVESFGWRVVVDPAASACVRFSSPYERTLNPDGCVTCRRVAREREALTRSAAP